MRITRIDFLGFTVTGPQRRGTRSAYALSGANAWPGWTVRVEGQAILLEGEGRLVELPRNKCVVEWDTKAVPEEVPVKRGPGRPPKGMTSGVAVQP
jgi:hypothetical protein